MLLENGPNPSPNPTEFHWELSRLKNELMTTDTEDLHSSVVSDFTIALLNDTGWYQVTDYLRDPLTWGQSKGCDFFENACDSQKSYEEFC